MKLSEVPELAGLSPTPLGEGLDHVALDFGGRFVVRLSKGEDPSANSFAVEARLTAWLAPRMPLAVPVYALVGEGFGGYPKLPGAPALERALADVAPVHALLRALHGVDVNVARALGVPEEEPALDAWRDEAIEVAGPTWTAFLRRLPPLPPPHEACLIHGDFAAEHVLLDDAGRPTAVIDWSDAAIGDPARDLAGLLHWGVALPAELNDESNSALLERALWYAVCRAFADVRFGRETGRAAYVEAGEAALARLTPRTRREPRR